MSRYQSKTALLTRRGHRINLRPQREGRRPLKFGALLGAVGRLPVRVIIERVPKEVRRAHIREIAQAHGRQPDEEVLYLAGWTIVVTNVPPTAAEHRAGVHHSASALADRAPVPAVERAWTDRPVAQQETLAHPVRTVCQTLRYADPAVAHSTGLRSTWPAW